MTLSLAALASCAVAVNRDVEDSRDELDGTTYDYVIVGAGPSGLVVANRLTEDRQSKSNSHALTRSLLIDADDSTPGSYCPCH